MCSSLFSGGRVSKAKNEKSKKGKKAPRKRLPPPPAVPPPPPPVAADPDGHDPLSARERAFVNAFIVHRQTARAYREISPCVSFQSSFVRGRELRDRPHVRAEIEAVNREQRAKYRLTADKVLRELLRIAFSDVEEVVDPVTNQIRPIRDIPINTRRAISSIKSRRTRIEVRKEGKTTVTESEYTIEVKFWDKLTALDRLFKSLGLSQEIPPLDALLLLLPKPVATAFRALVAPKPAVSVEAKEQPVKEEVKS